jgi:hypothetical protein
MITWVIPFLQNGRREKKKRMEINESHCRKSKASSSKDDRRSGDPADPGQNQGDII